MRSKFSKKKSQKFRPVLWILHKNRDMSEGDKQKEINTAIGMLKNNFKWDQAEEFKDTVGFLQTGGCPEVPEFS